MNSTPTETAWKLEGIVPILVTPFDSGGSIDTHSLHRLIDFNIDAGVHGLGVAIGSEIFRLDAAERAALSRYVIGHVDKRVPVVINSSAPGTDVTLRQCEAAQRAGADALMIYAPHFVPIGPEETVGFFEAINANADIPIILQDIPQAPISPALAIRIANACANVTHIKVETLPVTSQVGAMADRAGGVLSVFGGAGGGYFIEELRRGARGTMPFCSQPAAFVETWNRFQADDEAGARDVFGASLMAVNRLGAQGGDLYFALHKQLLMRLDIIDTAYVRAPTRAIDAITQQEINVLIDQLVANEKATR